MEENVANLVLKELREFREENDKRLTNIEGRVTNIEENLTNIEDRVTELETGRKEDREDILDILETMQKSITEKFDQLNKSMDVKFEKVFATEKVSDMEQQIMKEKIDGVLVGHLKIEGQTGGYPATMSRKFVVKQIRKKYHYRQADEKKKKDVLFFRQKSI